MDYEAFRKKKPGPVPFKNRIPNSNNNSDSGSDILPVALPDTVTDTDAAAVSRGVQNTVNGLTLDSHNVFNLHIPSGIGTTNSNLTGVTPQSEWKYKTILEAPRNITRNSHYSPSNSNNNTTINHYHYHNPAPTPGPLAGHIVAESKDSELLDDLLDRMDQPDDISPPHGNTSDNTGPGQGPTAENTLNQMNHISRTPGPLVRPSITPGPSKTVTVSESDLLYLSHKEYQQNPHALEVFGKYRHLVSKKFDWMGNRPLFQMIIQTMQRVKSYGKAITEFRNCSIYPNELFFLSKNSLKNWFTKDGTFRPEAEQRWRAGGGGFKREFNGRKYFLSEHKELHEDLVKFFKDQRDASFPVTSGTAFPVFQAILRQTLPNINFIPSRRYIRRWLRRYCDFTYRRVTHNKTLLPPDWMDKKKDFVNRIIGQACNMKIKHPEFIINWDQTGVMLMPHSKYTYNLRSSKQNSVHGYDDKRQITAVVATNFAGEILPLQLIFKGQDKKIQQKKAVPSLVDNDALQHDITSAGWHLTQSHNHWSVFSTMKEYIQNIIDPYVAKQQRRFNESSNKAILILDCWKVHKGEEFLSWMRRNRPQYSLIFVPARCTGELQPCDLFLQRPFKLCITNEYNKWSSEQIQICLNEGKSINQLKLDHGMPALKKQSVQFTYASWKSMQTPQIKTLIRLGLDDLGFKDMFKPEVQLPAYRDCIDRNLLTIIEHEDPQEVESDPEEEYELEDEESSQDEEGDESNDAYVRRSPVQIIHQSVSSRMLRSRTSRNNSSADALLAAAIQADIDRELDEHLQYM
jgi:hypothetical protein